MAKLDNISIEVREAEGGVYELWLRHPGGLGTQTIVDANMGHRIEDAIKLIADATKSYDVICD